MCDPFEYQNTEDWQLAAGLITKEEHQRLAMERILREQMDRSIHRRPRWRGSNR